MGHTEWADPPSWSFVSISDLNRQNFRSLSKTAHYKYKINLTFILTMQNWSLERNIDTIRLGFVDSILVWSFVVIHQPKLALKGGFPINHFETVGLIASPTANISQMFVFGYVIQWKSILTFDFLSQILSTRWVIAKNVLKFIVFPYKLYVSKLYLQ